MQRFDNGRTEQLRYAPNKFSLVLKETQEVSWWRDEKSLRNFKNTLGIRCYAGRNFNSFVIRVMEYLRNRPQILDMVNAVFPVQNNIRCLGNLLFIEEVRRGCVRVLFCPAYSASGGQICRCNLCRRKTSGSSRGPHYMS